MTRGPGNRAPTPLSGAPPARRRAGYPRPDGKPHAARREAGHASPAALLPGPPKQVAAILRWYESHARDLPWRRATASAWAVLVSEVMLQQTPAARVDRTS